MTEEIRPLYWGEACIYQSIVLRLMMNARIQLRVYYPNRFVRIFMKSFFDVCIRIALHDDKKDNKLTGDPHLALVRDSWFILF